MNTSRFHLPDRRIGAGVAIGVLVGVLAVGAVTAASPTPSGASGATGVSGPAAGAGAKGAGLGIAGLGKALRHNFRLDVTATNRKGTRNVLYVRGTLQLATGRVTVTLPDQTTQVFTVDASTVVREKGHAIAFGDLTNGERAMVFGTKNADGSYTAKLIRCVREPKGAGSGAGTASPSGSPTT